MTHDDQFDDRPAAEPVPEVDVRYSDPGAPPVPWVDAVRVLTEAEIYWISTVAPDGHPHVTPLVGVWSGGILHFCTGPEERKARNLARNPQVALTTGTNLRQGVDLVVQGTAVRVTAPTRLRELADAWVVKYGEEWRFDVGDGVFVHRGGGDPGHALVFAVRATAVYGFGKAPYVQTRWSLPPGTPADDGR